MRYQNLYKQYSELDLTNAYDRPVAIDGLQDRILSALRTNGGFGVFDEGKKKGLLRRSLLWHRGNDTLRLRRIKFPADRAISVVPSWSWMAYTGGIDYFTLPFGGMDWEEMQSPWSSVDMPPRGGGKTGARRRGSNASTCSSSNPGNIALVATARRFDASLAKAGEKLLRLDDPGEQNPTDPEMEPGVLCVVVGRQQGGMETSHSAHRPGSALLGVSQQREAKRDNLLNYFLLVKPAEDEVEGDAGADIMNGRAGSLGVAKPASSRLYERVGAGYLPERCIYEEGAFTVTIH